MKTAKQCRVHLLVWPFLGVFYSITPLASAQTMVPNEITTTTWDREGSPYIIAEDSTISSGHTLTIEAGVEVVIGPGITLTVQGGLKAQGHSPLSERIVFRSPDPDNAEQYWDCIYLKNPSGNSSEFVYCEFTRAVIALHFRMWQTNATATPQVRHCFFRNCQEYAIFGSAEGTNSCGPWNVTHPLQPKLNPTIAFCTFDFTNCGSEFNISGRREWVCGTSPAKHAYYRGFASPRIKNNIFKNLTGAALKLEAGSYPGSSGGLFQSNIVIDCQRGVQTKNPYDVEIRNNIFTRTEIAVERSGDLSGDVSHNCLFANVQDFVGYPDTFGTVFWRNDVGVQADLSFNIMEDPMFEDETCFMLAPESPCVDSGCNTSNCAPEMYRDICIPPSRGTNVGDIGVWGCAAACEMVCLSAPPEIEFLRGDANLDGTIDISDGITILGYLFLGDPPEAVCAKTMDADDNSFLEITDAIYLLRYEFAGGPPPPAPFLTCGSDPTPDPLPCNVYVHCQ